MRYLVEVGGVKLLKIIILKTIKLFYCCIKFLWKCNILNLQVPVKFKISTNPELTPLFQRSNSFNYNLLLFVLKLRVFRL